MQILLVDDSRTIRNIQKNVLARLGYTDIREAADGVEALCQISQARPDLALIDWNMPNMDGLTLVRKIRATDPKMPLIMCTTEAEKRRVVEALQAGVNNYIVKPFDGEMLAEKIKTTLDKAAAAPQ